MKSLALFSLIVGALIFNGSRADANTTFDLQQYAGKVVVVDFWASWCAPCRRSFPWMNTMQEKYADAGLVIVAVNVDRESADADRFLAEYPAQFTITYDPAGELAKHYGVDVMPSSIIIGRDGKTFERHSGFKVRKQNEYEATLRAALQQEAGQ